MERSKEKLSEREKEAIRRRNQEISRDRAAQILVQWLARLAVRLSLRNKRKEAVEREQKLRARELWTIYARNKAARA